jgi:hypothetical protein
MPLFLKAGFVSAVLQRRWMQIAYGRRERRLTNRLIGRSGTPPNDELKLQAFKMGTDMEETQDAPRTAKEIAKRAIIISSVVACAYGDSKADNIRWLKQEGLWDDVSPEELAFLTTKTDKKTNHKFTWRIETLVPLLWVIQKIPSPQTLTEQCNMEAIKSAIVWPPASTKAFIESSFVRAESEISEEYEKIYHAHWSVRDAEINNKAIPDNLDPEVVYERHYAINWIIGYMGQEWDDISTDT